MKIVHFLAVVRYVQIEISVQPSASPYLRQDTDAAGSSYWEQTGLNLVAMSAQSKSGTISSDKPFESYGKPAEAKEMIKLYPTFDIYGPPSIFASTLWV
ncbi:MAG: hypothetical protein OEW04_06935 [Nitrospirota bacterium]|nr:hypothetical protein [Nitrospirota bacterium]